MPEKLLSRFSRASFTLPHLRFLSPQASLSLCSLHNFIAPTSQKSPFTLSRSVAAATGTCQMPLPFLTTGNAFKS